MAKHRNYESNRILSLRKTTENQHGRKFNISLSLLIITICHTVFEHYTALTCASTFISLRIKSISFPELHEMIESRNSLDIA